MKNQKQSILEKYESYESVPAAVKAWITMNAEKEGKDPKMAHAGYKAAFKRIQNQTTITILKEDAGYMGGGIYATPIFHVIKARNTQVLAEKIGTIYDDIVGLMEKDSKGHKKAVKARDSKISAMVEEVKNIKVDDRTLSVISDPECVRML